MVRLAKKGKTVVRLKGGDPYIFGRGGEEGLFLAKHGVPFEVVPGITAALGAAATTGIPFTHRGIASEVTFATSHAARGAGPLPWNALGKLKGTIVFYMGTYTLAAAAARLIRAGRAAATPVAVVERATTWKQRTIVGTLKDIATRASAANVKPPSLVIVGDVVRLRPSLDWFESRPLHGRRILKTRPDFGRDETESALEELGAAIDHLPGLAFLPPTNIARFDRAVREAGTYDWVVFTSRHGVETVWSRYVHFKNLGRKNLQFDARVFAGANVAVIGSGTRDSCEFELGILPDLVADEPHAEGLAAALRRKGIKGKRILLLRGDKGRDALPRLLEDAGARVDDVTAYRSIPPQPDRALVASLANGDFDAAMITSGEIARNLKRWLGRRPWPAATKIVTIGPVTSAAVRALGWSVGAEAASPQSLAEAVVTAIGP